MKIPMNKGPIPSELLIEGSDIYFLILIVGGYLFLGKYICGRIDDGDYESHLLSEVKAWQIIEPQLEQNR